MIEKLKSMWAGLPKWAKIGIPVAAVLLFIIGRMRATPAAVPAQLPDTGDTAKPSEAQLAAQFDAYTTKLEGQIQAGLQTALTAFNDDLQKKAASNEAKVNGFGSLVNALVETVSNTHNELQNVVDHVDRLNKQQSPNPAPIPTESEILAKARGLSSMWSPALSEGEKNRLHEEAAKLYTSIGATYDAAKGEWSKNGVVLN